MLSTVQADASSLDAGRTRHLAESGVFCRIDLTKLGGYSIYSESGHQRHGASPEDADCAARCEASLDSTSMADGTSMCPENMPPSEKGVMPMALRSQRADPLPHRETPPKRLPLRLAKLEAESIEIIREVAATSRNPVMLYSIGKDSGVMLHLAMKAFHPGRIPFPLLHVDTTWKFRAMIEFRDRICRDYGVDLLVHINEDGVRRGINPITSGSALHTQVMKTEGLRQALDKHGFDAAFGGARRDEEKSRAKERIFSFRSANHVWDPRNQRPELWNLYNTQIRAGESLRVFPLSNWTEFDVWDYILYEHLPVVPLYFAAQRPVVKRSGAWIMVDDDRLPLEAGEVPEVRWIRFRTLGCYPLSGGIDSTAATLKDIISEMRLARTSERQGRLIDNDEEASMERKKREGYF